MAFTDPDHLADICQAVLDALEADLTAAGRAPDRAVRSAGEPVLECGGLYVHAATGIVDPGVDQDVRARVRHVRVGAEITVTLARCQTATPDSGTGLPSSSAVDADGVGCLTDIWVTQRALIARLRDGSLVGGGSCTISRLNPVTPLQPSGGMYGCTTTIDVALG